jgi:hypothetical protein
VPTCSPQSRAATHKCSTPKFPTTAHLQSFVSTSGRKKVLVRAYISPHKKSMCCVGVRSPWRRAASFISYYPCVRYNSHRCLLRLAACAPQTHQEEARRHHHPTRPSGPDTRVPDPNPTCLLIARTRQSNQPPHRPRPVPAGSRSRSPTPLPLARRVLRSPARLAPAPRSAMRGAL